MKTSKASDVRFIQLSEMQLAKKIKGLRREVPFLLYGWNKEPIATYTTDFIYKLLKPMYGQPAGVIIAEEYKGSVNMWAYKRADYRVFRRWIIKDYPVVVLIENINGVISLPKTRFPKITKENKNKYFPIDLLYKCDTAIK